MTGLNETSRRRIGLFLGVGPRAGGMFQYAQSVLEALSQLDGSYEVTIAYSDTDWSSILPRFGLTGVALKYARGGQRLADLAMALRLPGAVVRALGKVLNPLVRELLAFRCDVWIFPAQESLSYQMPIRVIGTVHDLMHRYEANFPEVSAKGRYVIREHRFRNIAAWCTGVMVDSEVGRQHVVESYGVPAAKVYPLPYVAPSYLHDKHERADFDTHYRLPVKFLFYPAQFWQHKNHLRLLDAVHRVAERYPDIALVLSGGKHHSFDEVQRRVEELGMHEHIRFVGYVPDADLSGLYRRARALVMPTFFGPTNIPPLEAMAIRCPVLISGIYGMPEQCGDAALYFDPNSVTEMVERIELVWSDDAVAADMARKGVERSRHNGQPQFNRRLVEIVDAIFALPGRMSKP
jgi:glycosyltransferase involved in cell wall biosynthesis